MAKKTPNTNTVQATVQPIEQKRTIDKKAVKKLSKAIAQLQKYIDHVSGGKRNTIKNARAQWAKSQIREMTTMLKREMSTKEPK